ncbi:hypothetical protein [Acinetobacter nectaris]|uniref:hypothetical protein n=1 Tax=Acinetobacter nectaris TaxID=1219382 RepID=UPI001F251326|nr:hypothetical protein [Acinetobacter nectaris]MCF8998327.1 hypothetical protein [Acinetobacter nectaris]MCF9027821.1 hypothetical protein [Acinetobacter nectaris]
MTTKKIGLPILGILVVIIASVYIYIVKHQPNDDDKAYHRTALCFVISKPELSKNPDDMYANFKDIATNGIPDYAYYKPKIYEDYAHKLMNHYFSLSPDEQAKIKADPLLCTKVLSTE